MTDHTPSWAGCARRLRPGGGRPRLAPHYPGRPTPSRRRNPSMPDNPPAGFPRVTPYLFYEDPGAAVDWLVEAFGFKERFRMAGPDGKVNHAEVEVERDSAVMMGHPGPDYQGPKTHGHVHVVVYIYVDAVHCH